MRPRHTPDLIFLEPTIPLPTLIHDVVEVLKASLNAVVAEERALDGPVDLTGNPLREGDPFLDTVVSVWEPVYGALGAQDAAALTALSERYPEFREAYAQGKVSHHILIARSDELPKEDTFELVAAIAERCRTLGYEYLVTEGLPTSGRGRPSRRWAGCAYTSVRSWLSPPFPRATSRSKASRRARTGSSQTRTAVACST